MEIVAVDGQDAEVFGRFYEVKYGVRRELEFPVGMGADEARVLMTSQHAEARADGIGAVVDGVWVGVAWFDWWLVGSTETVDVEIAVIPQWRRRGVGSRLLEVAIERTHKAGRRVLSGSDLTGDPVTGESPGTAFARAGGFVRKHAELHQVLELPTVIAEKPVAGYEIVQWREHTPAEWIEQFADLQTGMSEDVPAGERTTATVHWTPELIRDAEARRLAQGRFTYVTAAIHSATGELAAYTQMGGTPETPGRLSQYDTYVRRSHRGHGLGLAVKAPNLRALQAGVARPAVLHTWNAPENAPMIAVNSKLGFRPVAQRTSWELPVS
ncbi:GNAT family N-acetyltransferase [Kribbella sp. NPDC005582]|uniref:GNAT family N-acetyltransferase n=1 Tax=Kribbella sp. NPDC005582 TaxID=3156893 RepID=UPI0033B455AF